MCHYDVDTVASEILLEATALSVYGVAFRTEPGTYSFAKEDSISVEIVFSEAVTLSGATVTLIVGPDVASARERVVPCEATRSVGTCIYTVALDDGDRDGLRIKGSSLAGRAAASDGNTIDLSTHVFETVTSDILLDARPRASIPMSMEFPQAPSDSQVEGIKKKSTIASLAAANVSVSEEDVSVIKGGTREHRRLRSLQQIVSIT